MKKISDQFYKYSQEIKCDVHKDLFDSKCKKIATEIKLLREEMYEKINDSKEEAMLLLSMMEANELKFESHVRNILDNDSPEIVDEIIYKLGLFQFNIYAAAILDLVLYEADYDINLEMYSDKYEDASDALDRFTELAKIGKRLTPKEVYELLYLTLYNLNFDLNLTKADGSFIFSLRDFKSYFRLTKYHNAIIKLKLFLVDCKEITYVKYLNKYKSMESRTLKLLAERVHSYEQYLALHELGII